MTDRNAEAEFERMVRRLAQGESVTQTEFVRIRTAASKTLKDVWLQVHAAKKGTTEN